MTSLDAPTPARDDVTAPPDHRQRLKSVREVMGQIGVDALLVRSTDRYLNEYVPQAESTREWLTGFTGSMGDALVTTSQAFIFVDGRYHLQAEQEVHAEWGVAKLSLSEPIFSGVMTKLMELVRAGSVKCVGYETDRFTVQERETLDRALDGSGAVPKPLHPSPIERVRGPVKTRSGDLRVLDEGRVGRSAQDKIHAVQKALEHAGLDLLLIQRLDDLAYLTNLRADELPYQATFRGMGAVGRKGAVVCFHGRRVPTDLLSLRPAIQWVSEQEFSKALLTAAGDGKKAAYDGGGTTEAARQLLTSVGFSVTPMLSPLSEMKAKKTPAELARMVEAFRMADRVVNRAIAWLCRAVEKGERITEADFASRGQADTACGEWKRAA